MDGVIPEPVGGAHRDPEACARLLKAEILGHLERMAGVSGEDLVEQRLQRFRRLGVYRE